MAHQSQVDWTLLSEHGPKRGTLVSFHPGITLYLGDLLG